MKKKQLKTKFFGFAVTTEQQKRIISFAKHKKQKPSACVRELVMFALDNQ